MRMKRVLSTGNDSSMPSGSEAASSVARFLTASIVVSALAPGARRTVIPAAGRPFRRLITW